MKANPIVGKGSEKGASGKQETHFLFWIDCEGRLAFYDENYEDTQDDDYPRGYRQIPEGEFSHVVLTVVSSDPTVPDDETVIRFYVNGELDREITRSEPIDPLGADFHIGHDLDDAYFEGIIKDVRIWEGIPQPAVHRRIQIPTPDGPGGYPAGAYPARANAGRILAAGRDTRSNELLDHSPNGNHGVDGG